MTLYTLNLFYQEQDKMATMDCTSKLSVTNLIEFDTAWNFDMSDVYLMSFLVMFGQSNPLQFSFLGLLRQFQWAVCKMAFLWNLSLKVV